MLVLAIGVVVVDIVGRRLLSATVTGTVDLTQLAVMWAAGLAIPYAMHKDGHVKVEIATARLSSRAVFALDVLGTLVGIAFVLIILAVSWPQASRILDYGDISQDLGIPLIAYWCALLLGMALTLLASLLRLADLLRKRS